MTDLSGATMANVARCLAAFYVGIHVGSTNLSGATMVNTQLQWANLTKTICPE